MASIFTQIIRGESPASKVYEDDICVAFLDLSPVNPGHILVVPREERVRIMELSDAVIGHLFVVATRLNRALRAAPLRCEDVNYFLADGEGAGQEVPHVHVHVIPRYRGDGFGLRNPPGRGEAPRRQLDQVADQLRQHLAKE